MKFWLLVAIALLGAVGRAAGGGDDGGGATPDNTSEGGSVSKLAQGQRPGEKSFPAPETVVDPEKTYVATIQTDKGNIVLELFAQDTPITTNNFVFLACKGYYDGVTFHRVIPGFVAQGGDPTGTGSGGPGYTLPDEVSPDVPFERGTVAMANTGAPNSGGSQFFITYNDQYQPALNGRYTIFGKVVEGMEVVDSLTPRDPENIATPPPPGDTITTSG